MTNFLESIKEKARTQTKKIIFPESEDLRVLEAVKTMVDEKICHPILIGDPAQIQKDGKQFHLDLSQITILNPQEPKLVKDFTAALFDLRKEKGLTEEQAQELIKNNNYFGMMALNKNYADGLISGANNNTADTVRPALQIIKAKTDGHKVSSVFFMVMPDGQILLFADCSINIEPTAEELATIALDTAETAKQFGIEPKIAMLSFSTHGSGQHAVVDKVRQATEIAKNKAPELMIEGEMQADAALVESVRAKKFPQANLKGMPTILIFPDLQSGNIGYKLVERLAHAEAIGPMLQGLKKPVNDLSRGCKASDIVSLAAITVCQTF